MEVIDEFNSDYEGTVARKYHSDRSVEVVLHWIKRMTAGRLYDGNKTLHHAAQA